MKALLQRVERASVSVDGERLGQIGTGLLALVGVADQDTKADADVLAAKVAGLRIFADREGKTNLSITEAGGDVLVVSQFTLMGDVRRGRRPGFTQAADPEQAAELIEAFIANLESTGIRTAAGRFGAMMKVDLVNDGPFTLMVETRNGKVV